MYAIKPGYRERRQPAYFLDDPRDVVFQPDVYEYAARVAIERSRWSAVIVDVGCGRAGKLAALHDKFPDWRFVGIDYGANVEWCRENYQWGEWRDIDLDWPHQIVDVRGGVLVSADVIEHLRDPTHLLAAIRGSGCEAAVLSTPERDLTWGADHIGPPPNPCHVREWNLSEFGELLHESGLAAEYLGLTRSDDAGTGEKTILALVTP